MRYWRLVEKILIKHKRHCTLLQSRRPLYVIFFIVTKYKQTQHNVVFITNLIKEMFMLFNFLFPLKI